MGTLAMPIRFSAHIGFLFIELPFEERFGAAQSAGFGAVEHPSPFGTPADGLKSLLSEHRLTFVQMGFPAGDPAKGEKGFAALPDMRGKFRESVGPTLDYASEIGCGMLHAMAGVIPPASSHEAMWDEYLDNIGFAADAASSHGIDIIIEPIGPGSIANYFVRDPQMAVEAIQALGRPNVKLLFDVFHAVSLGTEPLSFMAHHRSLIGHVQIADYPGRHQPGSAVIDFRKIFAALTDIGFAGHVGCEYHPSGRTTDSFGWMEDVTGGKA
jgi:hydroxypyruvate isomerase